MSLLLLFGVPPVTTSVGRSARESIETLEQTDGNSVRNGRESLEILYSAFVVGGNARSSYEALWQDVVDANNYRESIEILQAPAPTSVERWGPIEI